MGDATDGGGSDVDRFAALVAHELRAPLATAANLVALMEDDCADCPHPERRCHLDRLRALIQRTADLLGAQAALATGWPGGLAVQSVAGERVVQGALLELKPELERTAAAVELGPLPELQADPGLLQQLLRNLIENAVRQRRPDAPPRIAIRGARRDGPEPGWEITVRDNGRGFADADAERIFAPFHRLTTGGEGGHGLGLALCRRIASLHGGALTATGRPGEGATFTLILPRPPVA